MPESKPYQHVRSAAENMFPVKKWFEEESWALVLEEGFEMPSVPVTFHEKKVLLFLSLAF